MPEGVELDRDKLAMAAGPIGSDEAGRRLGPVSQALCRLSRDVGRRGRAERRRAQALPARLPQRGCSSTPRRPAAPSPPVKTSPARSATACRARPCRRSAGSTTPTRSLARIRPVPEHPRRDRAVSARPGRRRGRAARAGRATSRPTRPSRPTRSGSRPKRPSLCRRRAADRHAGRRGPPRSSAGPAALRHEGRAVHQVSRAERGAATASSRTSCTTTGTRRRKASRPSETRKLAQLFTLAVAAARGPRLRRGRLSRRASGRSISTGGSTWASRARRCRPPARPGGNVGVLTPEEIWDVVHYVQSLAGGSVVSPDSALTAAPRLLLTKWSSGAR